MIKRGVGPRYQLPLSITKATIHLEFPLRNSADFKKGGSTSPRTSNFDRSNPVQLTMESDPNVLLALAAAVIGKIAPTQPTGPPVHPFTDSDDVTRHTLPMLVGPATTGMEPTVPNSTNSDDINISTAAVLDSLASVCVSKSSNHVVAVALEMDVTSQIAVLTIADNYNIGPDVVAYLNGLWRLMRLMSNQCAMLGQGDKCGQLSAPIDLMEPWRTEFVRRVYVFGGRKNIECIETHWSALTEFMARFQGQQSTLVGDQFFKGQFIDALYSIQATRQMLRRVHPGRNLTDTELATLICLMDGTVADVESLLDTALFETWAHELQSPGGLPCPLRYILVQLISEHRHILNLLRFSQSPSSQPTFLCRMTIRAIPDRKIVSLSFRNTPLCWQSLIESVCGDNLITSYRWLSEEVSKVQRRYSSLSSFDLYVHRVCALIAYLETSPGTSQPPFNYIGVSTLVCSACHSWIQAFNLVGDRQYRTRGTNGDWSLTSAMAELPVAVQQDAVAACVMRLVAAACVNFWTAEGHVYPASESLGLSDCPEGTTTPSAAEMRRSLLVLERRRAPRFGR
ncbi:hypothetical protein Q9L58_009405 [Maublancomyces gigas]|uniref:Uncharacterized protein n=1 Tax=Discina gigas TaxID=1032678 RepID=A0ABR3G732_9PEZI